MTGKLIQLPRRGQHTSYDALSRLVTVTKTLQGQHYSHHTSYDQYSRPSVQTYPAIAGTTPLAIRHQYNARGFLQAVVNPANDEPYYQIHQMDAKGRTTQESFGNGVSTLRGYDDQHRVQTISSSHGLRRIQQLTATFNTFGDLIARNDAVQGMSETLGYDNLRRLTSAVGEFGNGDTRTLSHHYGSTGNLLQKTATGTPATPAQALGQVGTLSYSGCLSDSGSPRPRRHAVCGVEDGAESSPAFRYDANGNLTEGNGLLISYTANDLAAQIERQGHTSTFAYTPNGQRYYRQDSGHDSTTTTLQVDGLYEHVSTHINTDTGSHTDVEEKHYLGGFAVLTIKNRSASTPGSQHLHYLHHDHLGSLNAITDASGEITELHLYDAWGRRSLPNPQTLIALHSLNGWSSTPVIAQNGSSITPRGYTGHEMLDKTGIIHMNGRIYDPLLGRFLQADPVLQSPTDLQSHNRYSYVRNNPLTLTDPSGFSFLGDLWDDIKGGVEKADPVTYKLHSEQNQWRKKELREIGRVFIKVPELQTVVNLVLAIYAPAALPYFNAAASGAVTYQSGGNFGDVARGAAVAYASAYVWEGTGQIVGETHLAIQTATHAVVGGVLSVAAGGSFEQGAIGSAFGKIGGYLGGIEGAPGLLGASVAGGIGSALSGGSFASGASSAAVAHVFNAWQTAQRKREGLVQESNEPSLMGFINEEGVNVLLRMGQAIGGAGQVMLGGAICYGSGGLACAVGVVIGAKGVDNFQAGIRGTDSVAQKFLVDMTGSDRAGTLINAGLDLGTSVTGLVRSVPKISAYGTPYNAIWYRGIPGFYEPAFNQAKKTALIIEMFSSGATIYGVAD